MCFIDIWNVDNKELLRVVVLTKLFSCVNQLCSLYPIIGAMAGFLHSLFVLVATSILFEHDEILVNPGFELPLAPEWTCRNCTGSWVADAQSGDRSFLATNRTVIWQGPEQVVQLGTDLLGGRIYRFSGYVKVLPSLPDQEPQKIMAALNYTDPEPVWQFIPIAYTDEFIEPADGWVLMEAEFYTLEFNKTDVRITIMHADPGVDFQVDTLSIVEVGEAYSDDVGILNNPGFENPIGGSGWYCVGFCTETRVHDSHTGSWSYKASNREGFWHGPSTLLAFGLVHPVASHVYQLTGYAKVLQSLPNQVPQNITAYLYYQETVEYVFIGHLYNVLPADGWVMMDTEFYLWNVSETTIELYIAGPEAGVDFMVDTLSLIDIGTTSIEPVGQVLRNQGFEKLIGGSGWVCYGLCGEARVNDSHTGSKAFKAFRRTADWNGPMQRLPLGSRILEGRMYQFRGYVKVLHSVPFQRPQMFRATMEYTTADESNIQFGVAYASSVEPGNGWVLMEADFRSPDDGKGPMMFTISGPDAGIEFLVDTLSITESG